MGERLPPPPFAPSTVERRPHFVGKGKVVEAFGFKLSDPLLYVANAPTIREWDASLICLQRTIAEPLPEAPNALGYWPQVSNFAPYQLGRYVRWLAGGRCDPAIDIGYVFAYFYGLERRALIDGQDILDVAEEVLRLIGIYGKLSNSFLRYSTGLLSHLIMGGFLKPTPKLLSKLVELEGERWADETRILLLGYLADGQWPMPVDWARHLASQNELAKLSVVLKRAPEEFNRLFESKYAKEFGKGLVLRGEKQTTKVAYRAASPTLGFSSLRSKAPVATWIAVPYWQRQFKPVVQIWNQCIEELSSYSRRLGTDGALTVEAFEALPDELKADVVHPKQSAWDALLAEFQPESGAILLPMHRLAEVAEFEQRKNLTKKQSTTLAELAESLGTPLEPDARYTLKSYAWECHVAAIRLPNKNAKPSAAYGPATLVLQMAVEVATADGHLSDEERKRTCTQIRELFGLADNDEHRMNALITVLERDKPGVSGLKRHLAGRLAPDVRQAVINMLVYIASDEGISEQERLALGRCMAAIGLEREAVAKQLEALGLRGDVGTRRQRRQPVEEKRETAAVTSTEVTAEAAETEPVETEEFPEFSIDLDRLRAIRVESDQAAKALMDAIEQGRASGGNESEDDTDSAGAEAPQPETAAVATLSQPGAPADLVPLLQALVAREQWARGEFDRLVRQHGKSAAAAIEQINGWADETLGDFVIEQGDPLVINVKLLKQAIQ